MEKLKEYGSVYAIGAVGYSIIEILWRGFTHWSMALTGGICFVVIYILNLKNIFSGIMKKCAACSLAITAVEFSVGCIVNLKLKWNVWDYSSIPFNILGQICPVYSVLWFFLAIPLCPFCNYLIKKFHKSNCA